MSKHFLSIADLSPNEIWEVLKLAKKLKTELKNTGKNKSVFAGKYMAMLFDKPSLRTKISFSIGCSQLGGKSLYLGHNEVGLGTRESVSDISHVISTMADMAVARVFHHTDLEKFADASTIPVINALSDLEHPCQALADLLTIWEIKGKLEGLTVAYIGDGDNNITHSLALGCALLGINFHCASPEGYHMRPEISQKAKKISNLSTFSPEKAQKQGNTPHNGIIILETIDPQIAVTNADVVYTDTWISMGDEEEKEKRLKVFKKFQVNQPLMYHAKKDAIFMHDMPIYRGNEVTADVADGAQSVIFQQAENRLHAQKALMVYLMGNR